MKKVFIIGGTGFIGKSLIKSLVLGGFDVTLLIRDKSKIKLFDGLNVSFIEGDFFRPEEFLTNLSDFDYFYQLAPGALSYGIENEEEYSQNIISSNEYIINFCLQKKIKLFYTSSSKVYGDCCDEQITESSLKLPRDIYSKTKLEVENLLMTYSKKGLKYIDFRISNVYGPGQNINYGSVTTNFVLNALKNLPLDIQGNPNYLINFIYIQDVVDAYIRVLNYDHCGVYNLCGNTSLSLEDYAKKILLLSSSNSTLRISSINCENFKPVSLSSLFFQKTFDWKPNFSIDEGLIETIDYYKKYLIDSLED